jgi:hypothetical protein
MATASACSVAPRSGPDGRFHEFERAVMSLVHGGCCATPSLSAVRPQPAPPMRQNTKFRRLGRDAWIETISPRDPILPTIRGAFVLPDVTVAHTDRPDEEHVDVLVSQANIKRITIHGDGTQTRSFCYVDDLVEAIVQLMNTPHSFTGPVNVGNPNEITMLELAQFGDRAGRLFV